jgi:LysM repeat protein
MRTDVKVGLVAAFIAAVAAVAYFAWPSNNKKPVETPPQVNPGLGNDNSLAGGGDAGGMMVQPPAATQPGFGGGGGTVIGGGAGPTTLSGNLPGIGTYTPPSYLTSTQPTSRTAWDTPTTRTAWDSGVATTATRPSWELPPVTTRSAWDTPRTDTGTDTTAALSGSSSTHTVVKGDTFGLLAKKYHTTIKAITAANPGVDSSKLKIGQKLNIPAAGAAVGTGTGDGTTAITHTTDGGTSTHTARTTTTTPAGGGEPGGKYTVRKGDTLTKISVSVYGSKNYVDRIVRINRSKLHGDPNTIEVGMVLQLPPK